MVTSFSPFTPMKVKKILRKTQPQFRDKLRKLRIGEISGFLIKKNVYTKKAKDLAKKLYHQKNKTKSRLSCSQLARQNLLC